MDDSARYAQALTAWKRGNYDAVLHILEALPANRQSSESLLLCARALIRKDRLSDAREWLNRSVSSHRTPDNHATQLMLQGVIEGREDNIQEAESLLLRALEIKAHHRLRAEVSYERAFIQFMDQRYVDARSTLRLIRPYADIVSVRAIELEGRIETAAGDYRSARAAFGTALAELEKCTEIDMVLRASLVCAFSELVAELDHDQGERLGREAEHITWGPSVVREQVQTLRYIGLVHRRAGRLNEAMRLFGEAASVAPGSPWQILGVAECASLCVDQDESLNGLGYVAALGYVTQAQGLVDQIEWSTVLSEQRESLLVLARVLARLKEGDAARALMQWFPGPLQSAKPRLDAKTDDRLSIHMQHTRGLIAAACGDIATGRDMLSGVHRACSRIGYRWRALEALDDIKRIDPRRMPDVLLAGASDVHHKMLVGEDRALARAGEQLSGATLRERFARQYGIESLRLADILQLTVRGRSNEEIANELGLAARTVKNKVIQLYGIVGVRHRGTNSRAELVARCMADIAAL